MRNKADPYDTLNDTLHNMLYSGTFTLTDEMDLLKGFGCSLSDVFMRKSVN